ncbi:uncharacterized protein [Dysidea avara]|uniref:uncharacterized protein isoform X2 n=1 Tax=Dysidea avara TaxID=196820 RepID=UPI00331C0118
MSTLSRIIVVSTIVILFGKVIEAGQSSCNGIELQVMQPNKRRYQSITNNTIVYKPVHTPDFTVRCHCTGGKITPTWTLPDGSVATTCIDQRVEICSNISRKSSQLLAFSVLSDKFNGNYKCFAIGFSKFFELIVFGPPVIRYVQPQYNRLVPFPERTSITLHCRATGYGSLIYYWERNITGSWITVSNRNSTQYTISTSGQYRCNVTNEAGSVVSGVTTLHVAAYPVSAVVAVGTTIILYCNVSGIVRSYAWQGRDYGSNYAWSRISDGEKIYVVSNIQKSQQFRCIAGKSVGPAVLSKVATIQVLKVTLNLAKATIPVRSSTELTCSSSLSSDVIFSWTHNGTTIRPSSTTNETSILMITNVVHSNSGSYVCTVNSGSISVMSNTAIVTVYAPKPVIITHPTNKTVNALKDVTFMCQASDISYGGKVTYSWHCYNSTIPNTRSRGQNTDTLTITRAIPPDEGLYYCFASNDAGSTSSRAAFLMVNDRLAITARPAHQTVREGEAATFTARANGIKTNDVVYQWWKMSKDDSPVIMGNDPTLTITRVNNEHEGTYYCIVTNKWGRMVTSNYLILVVQAALSVFTLHPHDQTATINGNVVFECAAKGSESLNINWLKNNSTVRNTRKVDTKSSRGGKGSILTIKNVTVSDMGCYQCRAINSDGETVLSNKAELLIIPSIVTHPSSIAVLIGQPVSLTCSATGPSIVYQWRKNGVTLSGGNLNMLTIYKTKESDEGTYQCIAINKAGNVTSRQAVIIIYDKPKVVQLAHQSHGVLGEEFKITCSATNDRDAQDMTFAWIVPDGVDDFVIMTSKDDHYTASSTLYISKLARSDYGTYKCLVTNNGTKNDESVVTSTVVIVEERSSQPLNVTVTNEDVTSIVLSWSIPTYPKGIISYYIVHYSDGDSSKEEQVYNFNGSYNLRKLRPSTNYSIYVTAVRLVGDTGIVVEGNWSVLVNGTTLVRDPTKESSSQTVMVVGIAVGGVTMICLLVIIIIASLLYFYQKRILKHTMHVNTDVNKGNIDMNEKVFNEEDLSALKSQPSIKSEGKIIPLVNLISTKEVKTSVGQPTTLTHEYSGLLESDVQWLKDNEPVNHPILKDGSLYIPHTELFDQGEYALVIMTDNSVFSVIYNVQVFDPKMPLDVSVSHTAQKVEDFLMLLTSMDSAKLDAQYNSLIVDASFTQHAANIPVNVDKNKYKNILPYDHSRVVLSQESQVAGEDYINASFIDGYGEKKAYIASQGPKDTSVIDFWKLIWEQNIRTVVMLTRIVEAGKFKCYQYWPSKGSKLYGNIRVTTVDEVQLANYCTRRFTIEQILNGRSIKVYKVHQFHFSAWPDHGVPSYSSDILEFHKRINKQHQRRTNSPMLVHCSAGVGRSGTFIAIDTEIQRIRQEGIVDVYNCVQKMRFWRGAMIQSTAQYEFVYTSLLEYISCGDTSITGAADVKQKVKELSILDHAVNKTGFQLQFEKLNNNSPKEADFKYTAAMAHKESNRHQRFLPPDVSRVMLTKNPHYITACYVNGYRHSKAYLVGQGPMQSTVVDFWTMIWEKQSHAIVMLGQLQENGKEASFKYWPSKNETVEFQHFSIVVVSEDPNDRPFVRYTLKVSNTQEDSTRTVTLLQYQCWSADTCPNNPSHIIDIIEELDCVQRKIGNSPITVHCSDGVGRSGTFCALVNCINRFKVEQTLDVFQAIDSIRTQQPAAVQTVEQYEFIHHVIVFLLDRYSVYSNFTVL